jgi:hypothetical protein
MLVASDIRGPRKTTALVDVTKQRYAAMCLPCLDAGGSSGNDVRRGVADFIGDDLTSGLPFRASRPERLENSEPSTWLTPGSAVL